VGLERGPLSLLSTTEELLRRKSRGSGLESRDFGRRGSAALTIQHPSVRKKLALTSPTSGGRSSSLADSGHEACSYFFVDDCLVVLDFLPLTEPDRVYNYKRLMFVESN
jgi:hypothetical protein